MMRYTFVSNAALAVAMLVAGPMLRPAVAEDPVLYGCMVKLDEDVKLPAPEAGVLVQLSVKEGSQVRQGDVHGQDLRRRSADAKEGGRVRAGCGVQSGDRRHPDSLRRRNRPTLPRRPTKRWSNRTTRSPKPCAEIDVRKAKLEWEAAILSAEKAQHDQALAKFDYHQKKAERDAADLAIERRTIIAPFDGEVVTIYRHQDEWVSPGDAILRLVRLDTMLVEGAVELSTYDPHEVQRLRRDRRSRNGPRSQRTGHRSDHVRQLDGAAATAATSCGPKSPIARSTAAGCCATA